MMMIIIMKIICYYGDNNDNKICSVNYGNNSISYNNNDNENNNKYNILINGDDGRDDECGDSYYFNDECVRKLW